ncbi:DUF547 domain-containing protein [Pseudidiomarina aquimaris]|uniref:DUF547 domain-containing protein n=1 Tax=Pseudidiomarina aquimaris TaxID=641841 RepID=UPI001F544B13|nr:DUF547 domain-containing protein [Pseudidiomarina aquimaris]
MKNKLITIITLIWLLPLTAVFAESQGAVSFDHSHAAYTDLLQKHVWVYNEGRRSVVDYAALQADEPALNAYLQDLADVSVDQYRSWSEDQQLAFLINAYNAFTLELIVDHYESFVSGERESIRDLGGLFYSAWEREVVELLGKMRTLDWVEHKTIRVYFDEPRIHAALVCAAMSCPKLRAEAYTASALDTQLDDQMRTFLSDRALNGIDAQGLYLSRIFDWYEEDFGDLRVYMRQYASVLADDKAEREALAGDIRIRYTDYDWRLNTRENAGLLKDAP